MKLFQVNPGKGFVCKFDELSKPDKKAKTKPWTMKEELHFELHEMEVDPVPGTSVWLENGYEGGTFAKGCEDRGYYIFTRENKKGEVWALAVNKTGVEIV